MTALEKLDAAVIRWASRLLRAQLKRTGVLPAAQLPARNHAGKVATKRADKRGAIRGRVLSATEEPDP